MVKRPLAISLVLAIASCLPGCSSPSAPPLPDPPRAFQSGGGPLPRTLNESLRALERTLPAATQVKMRTGAEKDMIKYWDTVGRWMRNTWVMGNEPKPLREWFQTQYRMHDAEEISVIVLTSFWRYLNERPEDLEGQIREARSQREALEIAEEGRRQLAAKAGRAISASRLGWRLDAAPVPAVSLPIRRSDEFSLQARYIAPFMNGLLITGKHFAADAGPPGRYDRADEQFRTICYFVDLETLALHPVESSETGPVEECVIAGDAAFFRGVQRGRSVIVRVTEAGRQVVARPRGGGWLRLGIGEDQLLAIGANSISRLDDSTWKPVYTTQHGLPRTAEPPRQFDRRVWFRDEGPGDGTPGRLSWVNLNPRAELRYFDEDTGWNALIGFNPRIVWRFARAPDQTVWILPRHGLVVSEGEQRYRTAILNGRPDFAGDRPDVSPQPAKGADIHQPTGIEFERGGCAKLATGADVGAAAATLYRVCQGVVRPLLSFRRTEQVVAIPDGRIRWQWVATFILTIDDRRMVIGGESGGLYLFTEGSDRRWTVKSLDEKPGRPIAF